MGGRTKQHSSSKSNKRSEPASPATSNDLLHPKQASAADGRLRNPRPLQKGRIISLNTAEGYGFLRPLESKSQEQSSNPTSNTPHNESDSSKVYFRLPPLDLDMDTSCHTGLMELRVRDTLEFISHSNGISGKAYAHYSRLIECSARSPEDMSAYLHRLLSLCAQHDPKVPMSRDRTALVLREVTTAPQPIRLILSHPSHHLQQILLALKLGISVSEFCSKAGRSLHSSKFNEFLLIFTESPSGFFTHLCTVLRAIKLDDRTSVDTSAGFVKTPFMDKRAKVQSEWGEPLHTLIESIKGFVLTILKALPQELPQLFNTIQALDKIPGTVQDEASTSSFALQALGVVADSKGTNANDPNRMKWSEIPLVPLMSELAPVFNQISSTINLPVAKIDGGYERTEDYIDTYFRLLREDSFASLKKGISDFISGRLDHRDMTVWSGVTAMGVHFGKSMPGMTLGLLLKPNQANRRSPKPPLPGSLLCICDLGGSYPEPIWAIAEKCEESKKKTILFVNVLDSVLRLSGNGDLRKAATWARFLHAESLVVAESPAYYRACEPVLRSLQYLDPKTMPFQEELVHVKSPRKGPAYLNDSTVLDWRCLNAGGRSSAYGDFKAGIDELRMKSLSGFTTTLDPTQINAVNHVLENRLAIIQGPPGTGKTFLTVKIVELLLSANTRRDKPILVMTYKNLALDQFLEACLKFCQPTELVRVGGGHKTNALADCNLINILNKQGLSCDERANRDMLQNLQSKCWEALVDLYRCQKLSVNAITTNPLLRGFQQKLLLPRGANIEGTQITEVNCNYLDLESRETKASLSKRLKDWMPPQNVFRAVQACLLSMQQISIPKAAPALPIWRENRSHCSGEEEKQADPEDSEDEADRKESEELLSEIRGESSKGKLKSSWLVNDFLSLQDVPKNDTIQGLSLVNFEPAGYSWLLDADPWQLSVEQRCIMMLLMMRRNLDEKIKQFGRIKEQYDQVCKENTELNKRKRAAILENAKIIGMTTTGAAMNQDVLAVVSPSIIVVEESGEILEPQLMAVLSPSVDHLILVGDHKQLRPSINSYELVKNHNLGISMLERLAINNLPYESLGLQSRMREEFLRMVAPMYPTLKSNVKVVNGRKNKPAECMSSTMYFWHHSNEETEARSPTNLREAHMVIALSKWLLSEGLKQDEISVICAYNGQVKLLKNLLDANGDREAVINVQTIDRFQGSENRVVIVSTVRSNAKGIIGHLKEPNRLCVAVSRARSGFYICGNAETLSQKSKDWRQLIEECFKKRNLLGETIFLACPRHPNDPLIELHNKDAEKFSPTSGCKRLCNAVMACLHTCKTTCHSGAHPPCKESVLHSFKTCQHSTVKVCSTPDHSLKCNEEVWITLDACAHSIKCKCWEKQENTLRAVSCTYTCSKTLLCGHPCELLCGIPCSSRPCKICDEIKRIQVMKEQELQKKKLEERLKSIDDELQKLENESADGPFIKELSLEGETAAEYCMVKDRTEKFIQQDHQALLVVRKVEKVTNRKLEVAFLKAQKDLIDPTAPTQLLFHGTSDEGVLGITINGFRLPAASARNMFGQGCYFATDSSKSAQILYTKGSNKLLLCEVLLGTPWSVNSAKEDLNLKVVRNKGYDSVFSMRNSSDTQGTNYDEYIIYDPRQAIPRYVIYYDSMKCTDPEMQRLLWRRSNMDFERRPLNASSSSSFHGLTADEMHYRFAESQFLRMCGESGKIKEVEYTRSSALEEKYEECKKEIGARTDINERLLFHGTSNEAVDKIIREGFKVGGQEVAIRTGSVYGQGVYVAANPATAMHYAQDSRMMLLSLAVCGEEGVDHKLCGSPNNIFVLTKGSQLLPRYIVHFL